MSFSTVALTKTTRTTTRSVVRISSQKFGTCLMPPANAWKITVGLE
ncbi:hypothetical protein ANCCAN_17078 [Ancylostoma caninum]|uniref:Uncharacterized protein n=1 Tax=Ancylostoma caninum TaxID=29170 RepID=A0A368FZZ3_ANCCA|nr:hypothetical protein ANCCAN_17078 [Ancylostoma caninum]